MDSRLLNVFHEDPFEGNFAKYEAETSFWSNDNDDTMSMQLTDTLNGILPIPPTDEALLNHSEEELQTSKNLLIYNEFVEHQLSDGDVLNAQVYHQDIRSASQAEAAFAQQQRQLSALVDYDHEDEEGDDDAQSQYSNSTFRSRTDSSSIADYESHSSDYDDEEDERVLPADAFALATEPAEQYERKDRTLSTNTVCSDADGFGLNIDGNNFDLADFITKDDFAMNMNSFRVKEAPPAATKIAVPTAVIQPVKLSNKSELSLVAPIALPKPKSKSVIISAKSLDTEDDSDSIIDVETVDVDESMWVAAGKKAAPTAVASTSTSTTTSATAEDLCYVDNVKADPSWCPKQTKKLVTGGSAVKEHKTAQADQPLASNSSLNVKAAPIATAVAVAVTAKPKPSNICLVPNKKQCEFLKRKVNATTATKSTKAAAKKAHEAIKTAAKQLTNVKASSSSDAASNTMRTGLGLGGKNLALLKHERDSIAEAAVIIAPQQPPLAAVAATPCIVAAPPKRKLNLEEYKQRRGGGGVPATPKLAKLEPSKTISTATTAVAAPTKPTTTPSPHKAFVSNIVHSLKSSTSQTTAPVATDPITVAKNKVLRMLEMKRAQQLKIIDSRISAKVPRVTRLPTLKDIVKDGYCMQTEETVAPAVAAVAPASSKLQANYEEIIIVSASCNTDITIPPSHLGVSALKDSKTTPSSRSLLKSSVLLYNISNGQDASRNMTNSLIASIQSEVVKQTSCALSTPTPAATPSAAPLDKNAQHGEDMVIMHLPKDRVRKRLVSAGTQTELQPEFPLLTLPATRKSRERTRRSYRKRRNSSHCVSAGSGSDSSSSSSSSTDCSSVASYRSRSNSNSTERLRHSHSHSDAMAACGSSSIGGGGYSSRSTRRHRSSVSSSSNSEACKYERQQRRQRRTSYNKRRSKNHARGRASCSSSASEFSDRSRSPQRPQRSRSPSSNNNNNRRGFVDRNVSQPAVEERRIVYVGRIEQDTSKELLRRKFLPYGPIKQITIHYKENGMKYGFVTFDRAQDAFTAIDTSPRDAQINMYDISFGGRRAFCRASYADLDNAGINNYHSYVFPNPAPAAPKQEDSFEALLLKVKAKMNAGKPAAAAPAQEAETSNNNTDNSQI